VRINTSTQSASTQDAMGEDDSDGEIEYMPREDGDDINGPGTVFVPKTDTSEMLGMNDIAAGIAESESLNITLGESTRIKNENPMKAEPVARGEETEPMESMPNYDQPEEKYGMKFEQGASDLSLPPNYYTGATSFRDQEFVRKGQKETFYCELCMIELSSRDTLVSHENGAKHQKKLEEQRADMRRARNRGEYFEEKTIKKIANPLPLQKKVPIRLVEKLRETMTSIVGLDSIHEIIACSNAEVEPYYECSICGQQGEANSMFQHLQGKPHRVKFMQHTFPDNLKYLDTSFNKGFLESEIARLQLRENDKLDKINTTYSDEMFPWTAGKAPWSVEQGGTGIVPTRARNRIGLISQSNLPPQLPNTSKDVDLKDCIIKHEATFKDLNPDALKGNIETEKDLKQTCALVQKLGEKIKNYKVAHDKGNEIENELAYAQLDVIMSTLSLTDNGAEASSPKKPRKPNSPRRSSSRDRFGSSMRSQTTDRNDRELSRERDYGRHERNMNQRGNYESNARGMKQEGYYGRNERSMSQARDNGGDRRNMNPERDLGENGRGGSQAREYERMDRGFNSSRNGRNAEWEKDRRRF